MYYIFMITFRVLPGGLQKHVPFCQTEWPFQGPGEGDKKEALSVLEEEVLAFQFLDP